MPAKREYPAILAVLLTAVVSLACAFLSLLPAFTPSPPPEPLPPECAELDLTPEECANRGTHSYTFETEFTCMSVTLPMTEKFAITFSGSGVEMERIEPDAWSHEYKKVSANQYVWKYAGVEGIPAQVILEFNRNGFTLLASENPKCGKYIRTLLPE